MSPEPSGTDQNPRGLCAGQEGVRSSLDAPAASTERCVWWNASNVCARHTCPSSARGWSGARGAGHKPLIAPADARVLSLISLIACLVARRRRAATLYASTNTERGRERERETTCRSADAPAGAVVDRDAPLPPRRRRQLVARRAMATVVSIALYACSFRFCCLISRRNFERALRDADQEEAGQVAGQAGRRKG